MMRVAWRQATCATRRECDTIRMAQLARHAAARLANRTWHRVPDTTRTTQCDLVQHNSRTTTWPGATRNLRNNQHIVARLARHNSCCTTYLAQHSSHNLARHNESVQQDSRDTSGLTRHGSTWACMARRDSRRSRVRLA
jgi:hypothetical protein